MSSEQDRHGNNEGVHRCSACEAVFATPYNLRKHVEQKFGSDSRHSAKESVKSGRNDIQTLLDPRVFHSQLHQSQEGGTGSVGHFPGRLGGPKSWHVRGRHAGSRVQNVPDPVPDRRFVGFWNKSMGSPIRKTQLYSFHAKKNNLTSRTLTFRLPLDMSTRNREKQVEKQVDEAAEDEDDTDMHEGGDEDADMLGGGNEEAGTDFNLTTEDDVAAAHSRVKQQIQALVTVGKGPLCLRVELEPPTFVMQTTQVWH